MVRGAVQRTHLRLLTFPLWSFPLPGRGRAGTGGQAVALSAFFLHVRPQRQRCWHHTSVPEYAGPVRHSPQPQHVVDRGRLHPGDPHPHSTAHQGLREPAECWPGEEGPQTWTPLCSRYLTGVAADFLNPGLLHSVQPERKAKGRERATSAW